MHRMRVSVCALVLVAASALSSMPTSVAQAYFQQSVQYTIDVSLDDDAKRVSGRETIRYTNNSPDTLQWFYLHLYPNAYRSKETAFMRDYARRFNYVFLDVPKRHRGNLDLANVIIDGNSVEPRVEDTIAQIKLPAPLPPGGTIEVAFDFNGKIRRHIGRSGYQGHHYDMAQWYPKVVVYDENGYHADQFMTGEFYGEFGTFDVSIDLPANFVVASTGELVEGDAGWAYNSGGGAPDSKGRKTVRFRASNVHDFAWCADPTFVVQDTLWNGVEIRSFFREKHASAWRDTTLAHAVRAMEWLDRKVGKYPYPQVSVVDALLGGGMEYPMLVMDGRASEGLVVHEVGHIYFYGILGNDEREEAWLDEGFTTFQTQWFKEERYGPWGNRKELNWYQRITPQYTLWEDYRNRVFYYDRRGYGERVSTRAEKFQNSYADHVYRKAALTLNALRYVVGPEKFEESLQEYYRAWQFKHVNETRFRETVERVSGIELQRMFQDWLHTRKTTDYRLADVKSRQTADGYNVSVRVERDGEVMVPITIEFTMPDGTIEKRRVDGKLRTIEQTFELAAKPKRTAINSDNAINDIDFQDNFLPRRHDFQIDWPNNHYYPEDAYQVRYRPTAWYNRVDGLKVGLHLRGSYYNWARRLRAGVYYGVESDRLDFSVAYDRPFGLSNKAGLIHLSGYKLEGRQDAKLQVTFHRQKSLIVPPATDITVGFNYHELSNPRYLTSPVAYDTSGSDISWLFAYSTRPQFDVASAAINTQLRFGRKIFGGDFKYERLSTEIILKSRTDLQPVDLRVRGFLGLLGGGAPLQRKFNLAGAGPIAQSERFWLRGPDAMWKDANYHEPGDGNLRGYQPASFGVNKLLSFNAELGTRVPYGPLASLLRTFPGGMSWYAFYDVGKIYDGENPIKSSARIQALVDDRLFDDALQDAGIGIRGHAPLPFWDLRYRIDLPIWLSHPEVIGERDQTRRRYLTSIYWTF